MINLQVIIVSFIIGMIVPELMCVKQVFCKEDKEEVKTSDIPETRFRSVPKELSKESVKTMLRQFDFYCSEYEWSRGNSNPYGSGFDNKFEMESSGEVVYDHASGLMWHQSGSAGYMTYRKAMEYITKLNSEQFAGYSDWRLPTLEEAMSLVEPTEQDAYLNNEPMYIDLLFDKTQRWIWTTDLCDSSSAWMVSYYYGLCSKFYIIDKCYVRAVR